MNNPEIAMHSFLSISIFISKVGTFNIHRMKRQVSKSLRKQDRKPQHLS